MLKVKLTLLLWLSLTTVMGQKNSIEEVNSLNDSSYYLGSTSPEKALKVAKKSRATAKRVKYREGEIVAYCRMGNAQVDLGQLNSALQNYNNAERLFKTYQVDSTLLAKIFIYQSPVLKKLGKPDKALRKYEVAAGIASRHNDPVLMASSMINASIIYKERGEYKNALRSLHKAVKILPQGYPNELGALYNGIGNIYEDQGRIERAIEYLTLAEIEFRSSGNLRALLKVQLNLANCYWDQNKTDKALILFRRTLPTAIEGAFSETESIIYQNIGAIYSERRMLDSASVYFNKSIEIKKRSGDREGVLETLKSTGEIALLRNNILSALKLYQEGLIIATELGYLEEMEFLTGQISTCYQELGNWEQATFFLEKASDLRDSIALKLNDALVYEIDYEKEKRRVAELELQLKERAAELEKQRFILLVAIGVGSCLLLIFYILYQLSLNRRKRLEAQKETLKKEKEINDLINKQEQAELSAMYNGQEKERNRIALELHDKLGGMLSMVKLYFKSIDQQIDALKEENIKQYQKATELLDEACDETRKIAHELSSKGLGQVGLFSTIEKMQLRINDSGQIKFYLSTHGSDQDLKALNQISIYRIIQELVNNILKHSVATEFSVQLNVFDEVFNVVIEDDGIGFDPNQLIHSSGIGLRESKSRVESMHGTFAVDSGRGAGTTITIDIPLKKEI